MDKGGSDQDVSMGGPPYHDQQGICNPLYFADVFFDTVGANIYYELRPVLKAVSGCFETRDQLSVLDALAAGILE